MYFTAVASLRLGRVSTEELATLEHFLHTRLPSHIDCLKLSPSAFQECWHTVYSRINPPEGGWPIDLLSAMLESLDFENPGNEELLPLTDSVDSISDTSDFVTKEAGASQK